MRTSLRWVLAYVIVAILWIAVMQWLLHSIGGDQWSISIGGLIVGGIFVLITGWLLFLLLEQGHAHGTSSTRDIQAQANRNARVWWAALGLLIGFTLLAQLFIVSYATREYRPVLLTQAHADLVAQVRLQNKAIDDWLSARNELVSRLAARSAQLAARLQPGQNQQPQDLSELGQLTADAHFVTITIYNSDHQQKLQYGLKSASKAPDPLFEQAAATSKVQFDCHFESGRTAGDCYWVLPVFIGHSEVSGGPWYLVFYAALDASSLGGHGSTALDRPGRTLTLVSADDAKAGQWLGLSLQSARESGRAAPLVHTVSAGDLACMNRAKPVPALLGSESGALQWRANPVPVSLMSGELACAGRTVLYASTVVPHLNALLWAASTQDAILKPIRKTRQMLAVAALAGVMALLLALFLFWQIMRLHHRKALVALMRERDQLAVFWEQMPSVGLALIEPFSWSVMNVNRRWAQIFHEGKETFLGQELLDLIRPVSGLNTLDDVRFSDQQMLDDLRAGIREEVVLTRRIRTNTPEGEWVRISIRALKAADQVVLGLVVALDGLGDNVDLTGQLQVERDCYRLALLLAQTRANHLAASETTRRAMGDVDGFHQLGAQIVAETGLMAVCLYTHWPERATAASASMGHLVGHKALKSFLGHDCGAPIQTIADQVARNGLIDRVLVAQTPLFIDDESKRMGGVSGMTLQSELIELLNPHPIGAIAMIPMPATASRGCVRAWILFGDEAVRFTEPVRQALMALLMEAAEASDQED